jgi:signal transduction histidine kinase
MPAPNWFPQQLVAFLEAVWSARTEAAAGLMAVERAAEALDAEIAAIVGPDRVVAVVGFPEGAVPVRELTRIAADGAHHQLTVPGCGACRAVTVSLDYPAGGTFVLARAGPDGGLRHDEASLFRGMARVTSMAMRTQHLLDDERAARGESDRHAAENARLLTELTQRQARLTELAGEQAALRRVATLVAASGGFGDQDDADRIFAAVAEEAGRLLQADMGAVAKYGPEGCFTVLAIWAKAGMDFPFPIRERLPVEEGSLSARVLRSGRPSRLDTYGDAAGRLADIRDRFGLRSMIGAPIMVGGSVWGLVTVGVISSRPGALPAGSEQRLADFTELLATAISNAASYAQLAASRARIVVTADETRRRIERDLHDGIQQRLVTLALGLRTAQDAGPGEYPVLLAAMSQAGDELVSVLDELREISRGVHPAILSEGGLGPALRSLARRARVPVVLDLGEIGRLSQPVEVAAYYVVSEALTNAAKHANATVVRVKAGVKDMTLRLSIDDDGGGGADPARGSGIIGLTDRVEALAGRLTLRSPPGGGTSLVIELPLEPGYGN